MEERSIPLLGEKTLEYLKHAHIAVFGLGGVGGYVVEALVRCGVGEVTLVDYDVINLSNLNRQIIATTKTIGQKKIDVMKRRVLEINPDILVHAYDLKISSKTISQLDFTAFDYVVDAIDDFQGKMAIIREAKAFDVPLICCCGTGNKLDPSQFEITDISKTSVCPLAKKLRLECKKEGLEKIDVLYSKESPIPHPDFIASVSFVPSVAGLLIARHIILKLHNRILSNRTHLVLEGGGMKGVYTSGVLDCMLDHDIHFDAVYGVSAGACNATSFLSKQKGRSYHAMVDYIGNPEYFGKRCLVKTGNYFNKEFIYHRLPDELIPFDYVTADQNSCSLYVTVTNVETGKAEYILCKDFKKDIDLICASSSLPLLSEIQWFEDKGYLDGGVADAIPIAEAKKNALRCVVILTKTKGYSCAKENPVLMNAMKLKYRKYPNLLKALERRHIQYNNSLKLVENDKNTFVIRPSKDLNIARLERDKDKLQQLYNLGYEDCLKQIEELKRFLNC